MQSFEASAAEQEAEERLEQLVLEDELSDAHLGGVLSMEGVSSELGISLDGGGEASGETQTSVTGLARRTSFREEANPSRVRLEQLSRRGSRAAMATSSGGVATMAEGARVSMSTTVDSGERERLEDSLAIAG